MMSEINAPIQALIDAINAGDTEAFVDAFTHDGMVDDWGRQLTSPDGVRSWAETDAIGQQAQMTVLSAEVDGASTTIRFNWRSNRFTGIRPPWSWSRGTRWRVSRSSRSTDPSASRVAL